MGLMYGWSPYTPLYLFSDSVNTHLGLLTWNTYNYLSRELKSKTAPRKGKKVGFLIANNFVSRSLLESNSK